MAFYFKNIKSFDPQTHPKYFFDTNIWLYILKNTANITLEYYEKPYIQFFEEIIDLNTSNIVRAKIKPKIVISSLLVSELINIYLRQISMKLYFGGDDTYKRKDFKNDYRDNPASDYKKQLSVFTSDFLSFSNFFLFLDDNFKNLNPEILLNNFPDCIDYNDFYFSQLMQYQQIPIVTNDKDFKVEDIEIITLNKQLLNSV